MFRLSLRLGVPFTLGTVSMLTAVTCLAQIKPPSDAWLMQNYRFAKPPAPGEIKPVSPVVAQLQEIQNTMLNMLHKADFAWDFEAALATAAQATANAQLLGVITGELKPPAPAQPRGAAMETPDREDPIYVIAFRDHTLKEATSVWRDDRMVHYVTPQGGHEQVRLDLVDWKLSTELNQRREVADR